MTKEQVLEEFDKGYDCCQVVFRYWAEKLNMDTELAYKVSSGFGAGMFQGETCGAVIGAYMALGLKYGSTLPSPEGDEQRVESIIKDVEFREKFLQKYVQRTYGCRFCDKRRSTENKRRTKNDYFLPSTGC